MRRFPKRPKDSGGGLVTHLGGEFRGRFRRVVFAVPDVQMAAAFETALARIQASHPPAPEPAASALSSDEKQVLKLAKRLREIKVLEADGRHLEKNQQDKVASKSSAAAEFQGVIKKLPPTSVIIAKVQDVIDYVGP